MIEDPVIAIADKIGWRASFSRGDVLARHGEAPRCTSFLLSGRLHAYLPVGDRMAPVGTVEPGDWFCEMGGILGLGPASATLVAMGSCAVIEVTSERLSGFLAANPAQGTVILASILCSVARRLPEAEQQELASGLKDLCAHLGHRVIAANQEAASHQPVPDAEEGEEGAGPAPTPVPRSMDQLEDGAAAPA